MQSLKDKFSSLGIPDNLMNDLDAALDKDEDSELPLALHVQGWLGKLMIKAGKGALSLVTTAEVRRFLGLQPV